MKAAWLTLGGALVVMGCGASGNGSDKPSNTAGTSSGGGGGGASSGGSGGGMVTAGTQNQGGSTAGGSSAGTTAGGAGSGSGGTSAGGGGGGGSSAKGFECPATNEMPKLTGLTPMRVMGVPPADDFNNNNNDFTNIEGAVWIGDALYVSEINPGKGSPPPSRILKITADDKVSIAIAPDVGSNGLATNDAGELFGALHKDGSISKLSLSGGAAVPVASMFMGMRFDSPNDLTIHKNGTIYFTDPDYQAPAQKPQAATRAYRVPPGGAPVAIEELSQPNGISLSKNQDFLYIGGNQLKKYPVMADGSLGAGTAFVQGASCDGMAIDCADNVYTASNGVTVYSSAGAPIGTIAVAGLGQVTNLAFGGTDHKTLYITGQGTQMQKGLFKVAMNVAGFPY